VAEGAIAARVLGALEVEESALFEIDEDGVGLAAEQAGRESFKMGVMPDHENRFAGAGQAEGHGAWVILGAEAGSLVEGGVKTEFLVEDFRSLDRAQEGAVPDFRNIEFDFAFADKGGELINLFFTLACEPAVGIGIAGLSLGVAQEIQIHKWGVWSSARRKASAQR